MLAAELKLIGLKSSPGELNYQDTQISDKSRISNKWSL